MFSEIAQIYERGFNLPSSDRILSGSLKEKGAIMNAADAAATAVGYQKNADGTFLLDANGERIPIKDTIRDDNPAMDIQGSTGPGSGEIAFTSVIAVAENTINGVNDFVQNLKDWMNDTFGWDLFVNYNKLVNINVSEAVMNNDSHSNSNILIGVLTLNTSRTKDTDYTGPTAENSTRRGIKFGYSSYAETRATNFISQAIYNFLNNHSKQTRVYVQNQQHIQCIGHVINILDEMNLDIINSGDFNSAFDGSGNITREAALFQGKQYNFRFYAGACKYLADYSDLNGDYKVDDTLDGAGQRKSKFSILTAQLVDAYNGVSYTKNQKKIWINEDNAAYNAEHKNELDFVKRVYNEATDGQPDYTYKMSINGVKINRNTDMVNNSSYNISSTAKEREITNLSAKYADARMFREKSDYIDMPNLKSFFTRQINQSIRDATKKRDLEGLVDEAEFTDNTYQDASKYDNEYAYNLLFRNFKGFDLYDSDERGKKMLRNASSLIMRYDNWNHGNNWFGHNAFNAYALDMKFQGKNSTKEMNAVTVKKDEIEAEFNDEYGENGASLSYKAKKASIARIISNAAIPNIEDILGIEEARHAYKSARNSMFLDNNTAEGSLRTTFSTMLRQAIEGTQEAPVTYPNEVTASSVTLDGRNANKTDVSINYDGNSTGSIEDAPSSPNVPEIPPWCAIDTAIGGTRMWASDGGDTTNGNDIEDIKFSINEKFS
ncbi:hypothetical protein PIROE2DRAFT_8748 [Piromyces sp. E2]|nr:hypothetical protein PIROE2DRAFT_8748 [Piromyces sp. E2]|eukprot:OUM64443.1 hypothetical protein PIROE2DRAFT_8748 [Piromyces sp. E2]